MSIGGIFSAFSFKFSNQIICNSLSIIGLVGILISVLLYNESFAYPSAWAIIPTISAVFLIMGT